MKCFNWFFMLLLLFTVSLFLAGCNSGSGHTSVLGVEAAWNQSGYIPSVRAGYINHDNSNLSDDFLKKGYMAFVWKKYDNVSLVSISGTTETITFIGESNGDFAKVLAKYIARRTPHLLKNKSPQTQKTLAKTKKEAASEETPSVPD